MCSQNHEVILNFYASFLKLSIVYVTFTIKTDTTNIVPEKFISHLILTSVLKSIFMLKNLKTLQQNTNIRNFIIHFML